MIAGTWAIRFNRFHAEVGHPFQGRYKGIHVERGPSLARVANYIHLNPICAGLVPVERMIDYRWEPAKKVRLKHVTQVGESGCTYLPDVEFGTRRRSSGKVHSLVLGAVQRPEVSTSRRRVCKAGSAAAWPSVCCMFQPDPFESPQSRFRRNQIQPRDFSVTGPRNVPPCRRRSDFLAVFPGGGCYWASDRHD